MPKKARKSSPGRKKLEMNKLLVKILGVMLRYRPEEITFAKISKLCKVPRATLYYYFGSSRITMLEEAIRFGMSQFVQIQKIGDYKKHSDWKSFEVRRMQRSTAMMLKHPWITKLYFRYRNDPDQLGQQIRFLEEKYFEEMSRVWAHFHGSPPSRSGIRFTGYLKLGLFFGFSNDREIWHTKKMKGVREKYLAELSEMGMKLMRSG